MVRLTASTLLVLNRIAYQGGRCNFGQVVEICKSITGFERTNGTLCRDLCKFGYMERVGRGKYVLTEKARAAVEVMRREAGVAA